MRCMNCPLLATESGLEDYDCFCLGDTQFQSFPDVAEFDIDKGGCNRIDKWINAQDPEKLKKQYWSNEAARWEYYLNSHIFEEK